MRWERGRERGRKRKEEEGRGRKRKEEEVGEGEERHGWNWRVLVGLVELVEGLVLLFARKEKNIRLEEGTGLGPKPPWMMVPSFLTP